jgi:hypothetical protein
LPLRLSAASSLRTCSSFADDVRSFTEPLNMTSIGSPPNAFWYWTLSSATCEFAPISASWLVSKPMFSAPSANTTTTAITPARTPRA